MCLMIVGFDSPPERITEILGLKPSFAKVAGEVSKRSGRPYRKSAWHLDDEQVIRNGGDHVEALERLLTVLEGKAAQFQRLRDELQPESITLYGGFYYTVGEQSGLWLDSQHMRILADCGIGWGVDLFEDAGGDAAS